MRRLTFRLALLAGVAAAAGLAAPPAEAQRRDDPPTVAAAKARLQTQPGATFRVKNIRGVSDKSLKQLAGTKSEVFKAKLRAVKSAGPALPDAPEARFDLIQKTGGEFPAVNQGACGSCWIFGAVASLHANILLQDNDFDGDPSEQYLLNIHQATRGDPCEGGWFEDSLKYLRDYGTVNESDLPYQGRGGAFVKQTDPPFRATATFGYVDDSREVPSVDDLKRHIKAFGSVVCAVYVGDQFQNYGGGAFNSSETGQPNHAVTLVGWDNNDHNGVWILRNSWGREWGEQGLMRIKWGTAKIGYGAMYVRAEPVRGDVTPPPPPSPDCKCPDKPLPPIAGDLSDRLRWWQEKYPQYGPGK